jgi:hypothetical protein
MRCPFQCDRTNEPAVSRHFIVEAPKGSLHIGSASPLRGFGETAFAFGMLARRLGWSSAYELTEECMDATKGIVHEAPFAITEWRPATDQEYAHGPDKRTKKRRREQFRQKGWTVMTVWIQKVLREKAKKKMDETPWREQSAERVDELWRKMRSLIQTSVDEFNGGLPSRATKVDIDDEDGKVTLNAGAFTATLQPSNSMVAIEWQVYRRLRGEPAVHWSSVTVTSYGPPDAARIFVGSTEVEDAEDVLEQLLKELLLEY